MDENVDPLYQIQLLRREPKLIVWAVGDEGAPPKSTLDPEILIWCEEHGFVLVTNNGTSMPPLYKYSLNLISQSTVYANESELGGDRLPTSLRCS